MVRRDPASIGIDVKKGSETQPENAASPGRCPVSNVRIRERNGLRRGLFIYMEVGRLARGANRDSCAIRDARITTFLYTDAQFRPVSGVLVTSFRP